jgi:voltage-dependent calcium channel
MDRHKSARMTDIPQFEVPEIIVDDESQRQPSQQTDTDGSPLFSATHIPSRHNAFNEVFGFDGNYSYPEAVSATSSPARSPRLAPHQLSNSGHSFDLQEPISPAHSRQGSNVSAENVLEVFSESAWGESLRRSFTMRRPRGS